MNAKTTKHLFSRETAVSVDIDASAAAVFALLTDAAGYPTWSSTVLSIEGKIAAGQKIRLRSTLAPERTFSLTVRELVAPTRLVWGDAMSRRTYTVEEQPSGAVRFSMHEKIGGPLFPLFARMIPPFDESFDRFAADLKRRAERGDA